MNPAYTLIYLAGVAVTFVVLYLVVKAAVRNAMLEQYQIIRWYENTGQWIRRGVSVTDTPDVLPEKKKTPAEGNPAGV